MGNYGIAYIHTLNRNMQAVKTFINNHLQSIGRDDVIFSLYTIANEIGVLIKHLDDGTFQSYAEELHIDPPSSVISAFSCPDFIWSILRKKCPKISTYPLGEITERSFKSTFGRILNISAHFSDIYQPYTFDSLQRQLKDVFSAVSLDNIDKIFLSYWFFNLAITNLRSRRRWMEQDYGFAYHFSDSGQFVSFADHISLRKRLYAICSTIAGEMLPFLTHSSSDGFSGYDERIANALKEVLGLDLREIDHRPTSSKPKINVAVDITGSEIKHSFDVDDDLINIVLRGENRNAQFDLGQIELLVGHPIHSMVKDFFEIGFVVYLADLFITREVNLGRYLSFGMSVRHPEKWNEVHQQLESVISLLGRDKIVFHFTQSTEPGDTTPLAITSSENKCCCLLSGGLDSAVGAIWSLQNGYTPIFVSHASGSLLSSIQKQVMSSINNITRVNSRHTIIPWKNSRNQKKKRMLGEPLDNSPMYKFLRSFYYLCLASGIALETKSNKVFVFENGPVALNPLLSEAHLNTRTVHPTFIEEFRSLITSVFGTEMSIENPFFYKTKVEVLNVLRGEQLASIIPNTNSCVHYARVPADANQWFDIPKSQVRHDGLCLPCILRRIATNSSIPEDKGRYLVNIFDLLDSEINSRLPDHASDTLITIADLLRFSQYIGELDDWELLCTFPDLSVSDNAIFSDELSSMIKRYSKEVITCFSDQFVNRTRTVFSSALHP